MKGKEIAGLAAVLGILCWMPAAYSAAQQIGNDAAVRVSGNAGEAGVPIAIEVYQGAIADGIDGNDLLGLTRAEYRNLIVCHDQGVTDGVGNYTFNFDINLSSGVYTVYTATAKNTLPTEEFSFVSNVDLRKAVTLMNTAANPSAVESCLKLYPKELGLTQEALSQISLSGLSSVLYETMKQYPLDAQQREQVWGIVKKAVLVQKLNETKITNLFLLEDEVTKLSQSTIGSWYNKSFITGALQANMTSRLSGKSLASFQAYEAQLAEAFILATVKEPNGNGNIKDLCTAFADKIGIDPSKADSSVWAALAGQDIASLSLLKEKYNALVTNSGSGSSGNSGSSGGSGRSGGTVGTVEIGTDLIGEAAPTAIQPDIFTDLGGVEWAKNAIVFLAEKGIVSGAEDGRFRPEDSITREEFCKLILGAFLPDAENGTISFSDAEPGAWYYPFLQKAYQEGIAQGMGDGRFGIGQPVSRQDMAVMIYQAAKKAGTHFDTGAEEPFADDAAIAVYAKDAVYALRNYGAVSGVTETEFAPEGVATRAQAAKMIYALLSGI